MKKIAVNYKNSLICDEEFEYMAHLVSSSHKKLHHDIDKENSYLGWVNYPIQYNTNLINKINSVASKIRKNSDVFIVIGIGGSYLGTRAGVSALKHSFFNMLPKDQRQAPEIYYAGNNLSATYINHLLDVVKDKDISINVISKSGTTTETAVVFRIIKDLMKEKYSENELKDRIYITTDKDSGALRTLASLEGFESFVIPSDIGGRFSVLTPVGLLPMAVSGININEILKGAKDAFEEYNNDNLMENDCYRYAAIRNIMYNKGKYIEILANYEPSLHYLSEWWKQLFGESEGKDNKGIFPASVDLTTDLHSLGQYIQEGRRDIFETVIKIDDMKSDIVIQSDEENLDGLNYLVSKKLSYINKMAMEGTNIAHLDGGCPNITIEVPRMNEYYFGNLIYFFEKACAISGILLGVNPFNQPGVEAYKKNMFALLGKKGFEDLKQKLNNRMNNNI